MANKIISERQRVIKLILLVLNGGLWKGDVNETCVIALIPYSEKFSNGTNFRIF